MVRVCTALPLLVVCAAWAAGPADAPSGAGEPRLRLAEELGSGQLEASERQRELLRLEYRLRSTLQEQGGAALELSGRLRELETAVQELAAHGRSAAAVAPAPAAPPLPREGPPAGSPTTESGGWRITALAGVAAVLAGALLWRRRRRAAEGRPEEPETEIMPAPRPAVPGGAVPPKSAPVDVRKVDGPLGAPTHSLDFSIEPPEPGDSERKNPS